ncbi:MAG: protein kinase [Desulfurococcales archaeon]|nr:protein kinase [Desulfurococcales archaeon]
MVIWESSDLGGGVQDRKGLAWSPDGSKVAVGTMSDRLIILNASNGQELWRSDSLGGDVECVSWSPDGGRVAIGTGYPSGKRVIVFDGDNGEILWQSDNLGGYVYSVVWSPDGSKIATGTTSNKVYVFNATSGALKWVSDDLGGIIDVESLAWSPNGSMLAAGTGNGKVVVFDAEYGIVVWENDIFGAIIRSIAWTPDGSKIVAGGDANKIVLLDAYTGRIIWLSEDLGGDIYSISLSSDGSLVVAGTRNNRVYVLDMSGGNILWASDDLGDRVWSVSWNPMNNQIAVGTGSNKVYEFGGAAGTGVFRIPSLSAIQLSPNINITLTFHDPRDNSTLLVTLNNSIQYVYASPGMHNITITIIPTIGSSHSTTLTIGVVSLQLINLTDSIKQVVRNISSQLASLNIKASSQAGANITITWSNGSWSISLNQGENISLLATPGRYNVTVELVEPQDYIGSLSGLVGTFSLDLDPGENRTFELPGYNELLGRLIIQTADTPANLSVQWINGSTSLYLEASEEMVLWAAPGSYTVEVVLPRPSNYVGPESGLRGEYQVSVEPGRVEILTLPCYRDLLGSLTLQANDVVGANVTLSWSGGSWRATLSPGNNMTLWAAPGSYSFTISLPKPPSYLGPETALRWALNVSVKAGGNETVVLPGYDDLLARLTLKAGGAGVSLTLSWPGRWSGEVSLSPGEARSFYAAPGDVAVRARLQRPRHYVGGLGALEWSGSISLSPGGQETVSIPGYDEVLGRLDFNLGGVKGVLVISWEGGREEVRVDNGSLTVWAAPGEYNVTPVPLNLPGNVVGGMEAYFRGGALSRSISLEAGGSYELTFTEEDFLSRLATLVIRQPVDGWVVVEWPGGSRGFNVSGGEPLTVYAPPGQYTVKAYDSNGNLLNTTIVTLSLEAPRAIAIPLPQQQETGEQQPGTGENASPARRGAVGSETGVGLPLTQLIPLAALGGLALAMIVAVRRKKAVGTKGEEPSKARTPLELGLEPKPEERPKPHPEVRGQGEAAPNISGYRIIKRIGAGGHSRVYLAVKEDTGEKVALKIPSVEPGATLSRRLLKEFKGEAETWSRLVHPNIVRVLDYGVKPFPYIAMEYMEGGSLRELLARRGRLSLQEALKVAKDVGEALSYAHHMGVVHRDIKPENILFDGEGNAKLTDFGLAKVLIKATVSGPGFKGTPLYAAPEQVDHSKFGEPDWRTDIWQYGALLYEMLTGRPPFQADNLAGILYKIITEEPPPPSRLNPEVPGWLDDIVMRCLRKRKEERWRSIDVILEKLSEHSP